MHDYEMVEDRSTRYIPAIPYSSPTVVDYSNVAALRSTSGLKHKLLTMSRHGLLPLRPTLASHSEKPCWILQSTSKRNMCSGSKTSSSKESLSVVGDEVLECMKLSPWQLWRKTRRPEPHHTQYFEEGWWTWLSVNKSGKHYSFHRYSSTEAWYLGAESKGKVGGLWEKNQHGRMIEGLSQCQRQRLIRYRFPFWEIPH